MPFSVWGYAYSERLALQRVSRAKARDIADFEIVPRRR
jgi:hypothetical protein